MEKKKDLLPISVYLGGSFGLGIIVSIIWIIFQLPEEMINLSQIIISGILFIVLFILYYKRIKTDFLRLSKKDILWSIVILIIILGLNILISSLFETFNINVSNQNSLNDIFLQYKIPSCLYIILFAPLAEELVFRYSIETISKNNTIFLIVSSLIFGIMHGVEIATILYIILGFGFGYLYLKTNKNITASILVHMINNTISILTMFLMLK